MGCFCETIVLKKIFGEYFLVKNYINYTVLFKLYYLKCKIFLTFSNDKSVASKCVLKYQNGYLFSIKIS